VSLANLVMNNRARFLIAFLSLLCVTQASQEGETNKYNVLKIAAHEWTVCRGVTDAVHAEIQPNAPFHDCNLVGLLKKAFYDRGDMCQVLSTFGGDGASIAATFKDMVGGVESLAKKIVAGAKELDIKLFNKESLLETDATRFRSLRQQAKARSRSRRKRLPGLLKSYKRLYRALVKGAREPDLPCSDRDDFKKYNCMISLAKGVIKAKGVEFGKYVEKHVTGDDTPEEVVALLATNAEIDGFSPAARASHFGALSIGHCQTAYRPPPNNNGLPGVVEALKNPQIFKDAYDFGYTKDGIADPTQADVREAIIALLTHWFNLAADFGSKKKWGHWMAMLARAGHTTGDSFSCSHTVREGATRKLLFFQDYGSQDGKKHAQSGDDYTGKVPFTPNETHPLYGFIDAQKHITTLYQIGIRTACSSMMKKPYVPVWPAKKFSTPLEEFQEYYRTQVFAFASDYFAKYPAMGCVTQQSASKAGQNRICKYDEAKANLGKDENYKFTVCPDKPHDAKEAFA
jgi:hypothetical protein